MQNSIAKRVTLSDRVATLSQELFSPLPVIDGQVVYAQMPDFQLTLFIQQALDRHYLVRLQFKAAPDVAPTTVIGQLKEDAAGHLMLKQNKQLATIVTPALLRSIQRVK
ncbi:MAG: hypothetical protein LKH74_00605 [Levilactobacillus sp.]|jgi:hypothetical protein|uniref:Uncharacterized protein n=1 Tax=Levilactobacillus suantsaiihabitans TaxID=2487722 RepID=A0A4Z0J7Z2_9LACO|nr:MULTISPECIES: hypothetical protein [Levilactobacillus]MCH4123453.1 hypothetical protein [Levilactobacillus sp.]MCI1552409.1 hypothetical protein [Levilactobacillus sp.]MCI1599511.1 hypothetical protein [Levilactobacillus sp.]MCI1606910.1 hypothetical protein [Levilactobacillus sp.]TGD18791.1 hypothetical protein EGT51_06520 [Levilactobacillus suantsaiihabitans]